MKDPNRLLLIMAGLAAAGGLGYALVRRADDEERPRPKLPPPIPTGSIVLADPAGQRATTDERTYWQMFPSSNRAEATALLAAAIASIDATAPNEQKRGFAWTVRNFVTDQQLPIDRYLAADTGRGLKQYWSTAVQPSQTDLSIADDILGSPQSYDSTFGATVLLQPRRVLALHRRELELAAGSIDSTEAKNRPPDELRDALKKRGFKHVRTIGAEQPSATEYYRR